MQPGPWRESPEKPEAVSPEEQPPVLQQRPLKSGVVPAGQLPSRLGVVQPLLGGGAVEHVLLAKFHTPPLDVQASGLVQVPFAAFHE